jgi:hypothetical protein
MLQNSIVIFKRLKITELIGHLYLLLKMDMINERDIIILSLQLIPKNSPLPPSPIRKRVIASGIPGVIRTDQAVEHFAIVNKIVDWSYRLGLVCNF